MTQQMKNGMLGGSQCPPCSDGGMGDFGGMSDGMGGGMGGMGGSDSGGMGGSDSGGIGELIGN